MVLKWHVYPGIAWNYISWNSGLDGLSMRWKILEF